jgi:hypothetical protein
MKCFLHTVQEGSLSLGNMHLPYFDQTFRLNLPGVRGRRKDRSWNCGVSFYMARGGQIQQGLMFDLSFSVYLWVSRFPRLAVSSVPLGNASPVSIQLASRCRWSQSASAIVASATYFLIGTNWEVETRDASIRQIRPGPSTPLLTSVESSVTTHAASGDRLA